MVQFLASLAASSHGSSVALTLGHSASLRTKGSIFEAETARLAKPWLTHRDNVHLERRLQGT